MDKECEFISFMKMIITMHEFLPVPQDWNESEILHL